MTFPIVQMVSCEGPPQNTGPQAIACLACPIATPLDVSKALHAYKSTPIQFSIVTLYGFQVVHYKGVPGITPEQH